MRTILALMTTVGLLAGLAGCVSPQPAQGPANTTNTTNTTTHCATNSTINHSTVRTPQGNQTPYCLPTKTTANQSTVTI
ncbi:MAG: hypothetical protein ACYDDF_13340 [Thermoplasmatota archaeon]